MRIKIEEATREQLLRFVQVRLGLKSTHPHTGKEKLVDIIAKHITDSEIEVDEHAPRGGDAGPQKERGGYAEPPKGKVDPLRYGVYDPLVNLTINNDRGKGGNRNVPCHLNGVEYFIPRNRAVDVPYRYFNVLQEAEGYVHPGWDDDQRKNAEPTTNKSYSFTVNRMPSQEELQKWRDMMEPHIERQRKAKMARINQTRRVQAAEAAFA